MTIHSNTDQPQPVDQLTAPGAADTLPAAPVANPRRTRLHVAQGRSALTEASEHTDS